MGYIGRHRADRAQQRKAERQQHGVYSIEEAARELSIDPDALELLCLQGRVTHTDLGEGEDDKGVHHDHLIRFTDLTLEEARYDVGELRRSEA